MLDVTIAYGLTFHFPAGDQVIGPSLRTYGEFGRVEVDLLSAYMDVLEPGSLLDVGANVGAVGLPLAQRHPDWAVWAVEGDRGLSNLLAANAVSNRLWNVEPVHAAVGERDGIAAFPTSPLSSKQNFGAGGFHREHVPTEPVRMTTLDQLAPPDTRLIKLDIEAYEPQALAGAARLLSERKAAWLCEAKPGAATTAQTVSILSGAGYRLFWLFVPFATAKPLKVGAPPVRLQGDYNCLALPADVPNLWALSEVRQGDPAPNDLSQFPYLTMYGFPARQAG